MRIMLVSLSRTQRSLLTEADLRVPDGGFFVFGDISCRKTGTYRLQFNLFDQEKLVSPFISPKRVNDAY